MRTETLTILDCQEFDQLVEQHLGVELQHYVQGEGFHGYCFQQNQNDWPNVQYADDPLNQNSSVSYEWKEFEDQSEESAKDLALNERYAWKLFDLGVFPKDHRVLVEVWW